MNHPKIQVESKLDIMYIKKHMKEYAASLGQENDKVDDEVLEMWIERVFDVAGDSIEINGIPYQEAFRKRNGKPSRFDTVYEPLDENLRQQADELQTKVQDALVDLSNSRKLLPQKIDALNQETIQLATCSTEKGMIELEPQPEDPVVEIGNVKPANYDNLIQQKANLIKELPETLEKVHQIENLLNDLQIPQHPNVPPAKVKEFQRRRSSLRRPLHSNTPPLSPSKAAIGLLDRLKTERQLNRK